MPILEHDVALREYNTLGLAVRARRLVRCRSAADVAWAVALARREGWQRLVLGGGSNVVFTGDFAGLVLRMESRGMALAGRDARSRLVRIAAGEDWHGVVMATLARGWPGLENLALIPGTVGAAPVQNIGAYGVELESRFESLRAFDTQAGRVLQMDHGACGFGYRDSVFKRNPGRFVILEVTLRLPLVHAPVTTYADVRDTLLARGITQPSAQDIAAIVIAARRSKLPDPALLGNVGSFFKNPIVSAARMAALQAAHPGLNGHIQADGNFKLAAAWLIDQAGWKGRRVGAAAVHERHALVLVNRGGATSDEVARLATTIRADIRRRYAIDLEVEPVFV
ncbi:MAG: UDP-N-acetylmuramate dehydrogenase [Burkholderiales bacterium]|nr:UDP-N-acetylmuramate dehydrogenase [Burkholderiales bacterium]